MKFKYGNTALKRQLWKKNLKEVRGLSKQGRKFEAPGSSKCKGFKMTVCLEVPEMEKGSPVWLGRASQEDRKIRRDVVLGAR